MTDAPNSLRVWVCPECHAWRVDDPKFKGQELVVGDGDPHYTGCSKPEPVEYVPKEERDRIQRENAELVAINRSLMEGREQEPAAYKCRMCGALFHDDDHPSCLHQAEPEMVPLYTHPVPEQEGLGEA